MYLVISIGKILITRYESI